MSLFIFHVFPPTTKFPTLTYKLHFKRTPSLISASIIPARDIIIDFGRHKGKMLGTLPSTYLKWVSKTLITPDVQHWSQLANEVLQDPVYKDRIEWEHAENLLTGDNIGKRVESPVEELMDISESFGWDNDDKIGWSRIDFSLLGTSKGGRIPRKGEKDEGLESGEESKKKRVGVKGKREVRIERQRLRRGGKMTSVDGKNDVGDEKETETLKKKNPSPFPGREALLKKVFDSGRGF